MNGEPAIRDYTPISSLADYEQGRITLWIRVYPTGKLTPALESLAMCGPEERARSSLLQVSHPRSTLLLLPPPSAALLLVSGGTGLAPILQALRIALGAGDESGAGELGGLRFSSVVLVHSARTAQDLSLLNEIGTALAAPGASGTPTSVHFAITSVGAVTRDACRQKTSAIVRAPFPFGLSHGRITYGGLLARVWGARQGICVVSGPQSMLDDVGRVAVCELGIPESMCHLLKA